MRLCGDSTSVFRRVIGQSVEGRDIALFHIGPASGEGGGTLLMGGIHGDEKGAVAVLESFLERVGRGELSVSGAVDVIPLANPDGFARSSRYNARGVDLNRNFEAHWSAGSEEPAGPAPWSEPESRVLRDFILERRPARIVSLHWALAEVDPDGEQSVGLARAMWEALPEESRAVYRLKKPAAFQNSCAESCPGSLGQWAGTMVRYPDGRIPAMVTLELPYDPRLPRPAVLPEDHLERLAATWNADASSYLAALEGPVHRMLRVACEEL